MSTEADLSGKRSGRLLVLESALFIRQSGKTLQGWLCLCDCGNKKVVVTYNILHKKTTSCGCFKLEGNRKTHGLSKTPEHRAWTAIKTRCLNTGNRTYANVRWATKKEQARNRRSSRFITFRGRSMTLAEASEVSGENYDAVKYRANAGIAIDVRHPTGPRPRHCKRT